MLVQLVQFLERLQQSIQDMHGLGIFAFAGIFVVAQMFMVPVAPLGMAFGLFFGFTQGWLGLMLGCAIGASINFLISRHLARKAVTRWLGSNEKFRMIDSAVAREGWKIVLLLRFVPVPFGLANYCYGLTPVRFWPYLAATCAAIIPPNCLFVWMGSTFHGSLSSLVGKGRPHHPLEYVFLGVGVLAAILALRYVAKVARKAIAVEATAENIRHEKINVFGWTIIVIGVLIAGYYLFFYDTSVRAGTTYVTGYGTIGAERVNNIGLMQNRLLGCTAGMVAIVIGTIMIVMNPRKPSE